ncbi:pyrimidine-nucleoside phosphorylase [Oceanithermus desulfurans NBRC 100063]|uniref:Pyrimidine-nucleoside phosphorylase n=2 Tax=Oceanithermus desulfurans TaxID=227924 RepID=A0A511RJL4_9DEIN|nr:pyrimidine-nucleoside phosphorylase [Oceanithermus desulfurans NBRC 100063]
MLTGMHAVEFIEKKRDGGEHSPAELQEWIAAYVEGAVPDYQMAAWLMAVYFRGMTAAETAELTLAMAHSGEVLDLAGLGKTVDKHSSGGVGDKTTLVVAPILAAAGLVVAKMSGRGLAHTGGTIDKLESIPGWRAELSDEEFLRQAREVGLVIAGQSKNLAPADGKMYALRDVTGTVPSIPLIASSIMSKKLAAGARIITLDVKVGKGAFMKDLAHARELARLMVSIGRHAGREVRAVLSQMDEPLGRAVGNAIEVREAIATLRGEGPGDLTELSLALAREALEAAGEDPARAEAVWKSGAALEKLRAFVAAQGGDARVVDEPERLELAPDVYELRAEASGVVTELDAYRVGLAVLRLGGGRERKGDAIDHGVGVRLAKKVGDRVAEGDILATVFHRAGRGLEESSQRLKEAYRIGQRASVPPLILEVVA